MTAEAFANGLVSTQWLGEHLGEANLRVLDCTTHLVPEPANVLRVESGEKDWRAGHIPGAAYVDLQGELSDPTASLRFMLPSGEQFARIMGAKGVGEGTRVVLYSTTTPQWATRIWWMLRAFGFDDAMVLDGGYKKWVAEGRPESTQPSVYPEGRFKVRARPGLFVGKAEVLAALDSREKLVLNALSPAHHCGDEARHYGRPGRIARSVNVSAAELLDDHGVYRSASELKAAFDQVGAFDAREVINYCGGGIAASSTAFVLALLGHPNVSLYDASLSEWATDPTLPMQTGVTEPRA